MEIQLGIVGPASFAEETQSLVHELLASQRPNGWDNQLKNEPGLAIIYERKLRLLQGGDSGDPGFDVIAHLGGTLDNVYTYANTGMEVRAGWNIPTDFGDALIRPAGDTNAPVNALDPRLSGKNGFGLYVFSSVSGRVVLRDIFLDGNTFTDSHSVDKKYFVADVAAGVSLVIHHVKLSYAQVLRTKEFKGQPDNHSFGSITISFSWRLRFAEELNGLISIKSYNTNHSTDGSGSTERRKIMFDLIKKTILTSVGLAAMTKDKVEELVKALMEKGEITENEGKELIDDLLKKSEQARKDLEIKVEDTVQKVLKKMDVATKKEIARLEKKVRNLEKKKASGNKTSMS